MHSPDKAALREYCPCPQEAEQGLAIWTKNKNKTKPKHINCAAVIISIIGAYSIFFSFSTYNTNNKCVKKWCHFLGMV